MYPVDKKEVRDKQRLLEEKHIIMDGNILTKVNSAKYLGVIIDPRLNWIDHITYVKNKISKGIGIIYKARSVLIK